MQKQCWLETPGGLRLPVRTRGVLIGRAPNCELVVASPHASRRHALVHHGAEGVVLVPFGTNPTRLNGQVVNSATPLSGGERIEVAGTVCTVIIGATVAPAARGFRLLLGSGERIPLRPGRVTLGGGLSDDLLVPGLKPGMATLEVHEDAVHLQLASEPSRPLRLGVPFRIGNVTFQLGEAVIGEDQTTRVMPSPGLPSRVRLSFLPRGGRLKLWIVQEPTELYLSDRRCSLVATLLQPPRGHAPGEYISDEIVIPRIWRHSGDRHALNVLVARTRKDLQQAGLDGFTLIERAKPGRATRFALAKGCIAEVV